MEYGVNGVAGADVINHVTMGQYKESDTVIPQSHSSMGSIALVNICKQSHATVTSAKVSEIRCDMEFFSQLF